MTHWITTYIYVGLGVFILGTLCGSRPRRSSQWPVLFILIVLLWPASVGAFILGAYNGIKRSIAKQKAKSITLIFKSRLDPRGGPNDQIFIELNDQDGKSRKLGTWAADGEYESLTITLKDFAAL